MHACRHCIPSPSLRLEAPTLYGKALSKEYSVPRASLFYQICILTHGVFLLGLIEKVYGLDTESVVNTAQVQSLLSIWGLRTLAMNRCISFYPTGSY